MKKSQSDLTQRELAVMKTFWECAKMTAEDARDALSKAGEKLSYPTVANVVRALVDKGYLKATNAQRPFIYRPVRSFEDVSKRIVGDLISKVFAGSREAMLVNLVERRKLTASEKAYLKRILDEQGE